MVLGMGAPLACTAARLEIFSGTMAETWLELVVKSKLLRARLPIKGCIAGAVYWMNERFGALGSSVPETSSGSASRTKFVTRSPGASSRQLRLVTPVLDVIVTGTLPD